MTFTSSMRSGLGFFIGAVGIPIAAGYIASIFMPLNFVKGQLTIPFWDGYLLLAIALVIVSMVSSVLYLACRRLDNSLSNDWQSLISGFLVTIVAIAILIASGNTLFYFLAHFGFAIFAGLLNQRGNGFQSSNERIQ